MIRKTHDSSGEPGSVFAQENDKKDGNAQWENTQQ